MSEGLSFHHGLTRKVSQETQEFHENRGIFLKDPKMD